MGPIRTFLQFHLVRQRGNGMDWREVVELTKGFARKWAAFEHEGEWRLSLDGDLAAGAVAALQALCHERGLELRGELWQEADEASAPWFQFGPRTVWHSDPDKVPPGIDVMDDFGYAVSERVRQAVEGHGLSCAKFLWRVDESRFRAPQWYYAYSECYIGHGLDHPWLDATAYVEAARKYHPDLSATNRRGRTSMPPDQLRAEADVPQLVRRVLNTKGWTIRFIYGPDRFLAAELPQSDFAFAPHGQVRRGNHFPRHRSWLYVSREARNVLLKAGVSSGCFYAVHVHDERPPDVADLSGADVPLPMFTAEEEQEYLASIKEKREAWERASRPERSVNVDDILERSERVWGDVTVDELHISDVAAYRAELEAADVTLPEAWYALATYLPRSVRLDTDPYVLEVMDSEFLVSVYREKAAGDLSSAKLGLEQVEFVHDGGGDIYAFDTSAQSMPHDCPVIHWNHELDIIDRYWPSVASFVQEMLPAAER